MEFDPSFRLKYLNICCFDDGEHDNNGTIIIINWRLQSDIRYNFFRTMRDENFNVYSKKEMENI